jgi:hypothetical protein
MVTGIKPRPPSTSFPQFPSLFGDKEAARLKEVAAQRSTMQQVYNQKFNPESWSQVNPVERAARAIPGLRDMINWFPTTDSTWDYGFNPDQAKQQLDDMEIEFKDLSRRQSVNNVLPDLINNMVARALSGKPVANFAEAIPVGLRGDFLDADQAYIDKIGKQLARSTKEEILSGAYLSKDVGETGAGDFSDIYTQMGEVSPGHILSTIAFSRNSQEIASALREAYPPAPSAVNPPWQGTLVDIMGETGKEETEQGATRGGGATSWDQPPSGVPAVPSTESPQSSAFHSAMVARAKELNITLTGDESTEQITQTVNDKQASMNHGTTLVLSNQDTGVMVATTLREDQSVWWQGNFVGWYKKETGKVEAGIFEESKLKDIGDAFLLAGNQVVQDTLMAGVHSIPNMVFADIPSVEQDKKPADIIAVESKQSLEDIRAKFIPLFEEIGIGSDAFFNRAKYGAKPGAKELYDKYEAEVAASTKASIADKGAGYQIPGRGMLGMTQSQIDAANSFNQQMRANFNQVYQSATKEHEVWLLEHPELQPRPEWEDGSSHGDPAWYFYTIAKNAPMTMATLATTLVVTALTGGNLPAGMVASYALMFPSQSEASLNELIANGADPNSLETANLAFGLATVICSLESVGELPFLKAASPAIMKLFNKELTKELAGLTIRQAALKGLLTMTENEATETATEVLQQAIQNAGDKLFNPTKGLGEGAWQVAYETAISVAPFSLVGGVIQTSTNYARTKANLTPEVAAVLQGNVDKLVVQGVPVDKAEVQAYNKLVETEEGDAQVYNATVEANQEPAVSETERVSRVNELTTKIDTLSGTIKTWNNSIEVMEERMQSSTLETRENEQDIATTLKARKEELADMIAERKTHIDARNSLDKSTIVSEAISPQGAMMAKDGMGVIDSNQGASQGLEGQGNEAMPQGDITNQEGEPISLYPNPPLYLWGQLPYGITYQLWKETSWFQALPRLLGSSLPLSNVPC